MQQILLDRPYRFVPPQHGTFWPSVIGRILPRYLDRVHGIVSVEFQGVEHLRTSSAAGHGVLITPNHCRPCDPFVLGLLGPRFGFAPYVMASAHLFNQNRLQSWLLPRLRVFSVFREGLDPAAIKEAVRIIAAARAPLVIFPEGLITRANDRLAELLEGPAFIAGAAAKERAKQQPAGEVVVHAAAIRYTFGGSVETAVAPVLDDIERRLTWRRRSSRSVLERIGLIGQALLGLQEIEYLGAVQTGPIKDRIERLVGGILEPLEQKWGISRRASATPGRVRALRTAILPEMLEGTMSEAERTRREIELADLYLAQQASLYPPDYIAANCTPERILETVERFEEDLTDHARRYYPLAAVVKFGPPLPVVPGRGQKEALTAAVRQQLEEMLGIGKEKHEQSAS